MNFNLDLTRVFKLIKLNCKSVLKYTLFVMLALCGICCLFVANIYLYSLPNIHVSCPVTISAFLFIFTIVALVYLIGFNFEITHNFIEEKDEFMPTAKGRFKEYMIKGGKAFLGLMIYVIMSLIVLAPVVVGAVMLMFADILTYDAAQFITSMISVLIIAAVISPFVYSYAHTFKFSSFFDGQNFVILRNSYPEFIYSYVLSQIFMFITSLLFIALFIILILIVGFILYGIRLAGSTLSINIISSLIVGIVVVAGAYLAFLINTIIMLFAFSLKAQSYNYGKYFLCKGEAPKRTIAEALLPFLVLALLCAASVYTNNFNKNLKSILHEKTPNVNQIMQNISK